MANVVKFNEPLGDYRYVLAFDLAKRNTGWALVDLVENKIPRFGMVVCDEKDDSTWPDQFVQIGWAIDIVKNYCGAKKFFVTKEKLPNQAGKFTTVASLQALAQAHATLAIACHCNEVDVYDYDGVHARSVKAYFEREYGLVKPTKEDIAKAVREKYDFTSENIELDITDAIAVVDTLVEYKWDADIKDRIKEIKKEDKKYKSDKKHEELAREVERLQGLLVEK